MLFPAVFPANVHVALSGVSVEGLPGWYGWVRLPFQAIYIWWLLASTQPLPPPRAKVIPART